MMRALLAGLFLVSAAQAQEHGTPAEAEAMVKRAVAFIAANGPQKAYDEFNTGTTFKDRDLYIMVYDFSGKALAQGSNPKMVGKDLIDLKDPDGKPLIRMFIDFAKTKGKGWSEPYRFLNPLTQGMGSKVLYIERVGDTLVGCGVYKS
jgi:signal transduction histidine kinase